ncbi:MAG: cell division ATP-binding protein FtsE [Alphaproteobacteria bacterium]|nr:cell division ATP-binding protein FtsE [Alphaproteobacteria bacterium]
MLVSFEHVSLRYQASHTVLSDINLALMPGLFYFLTGSSGAGKSSLLRLIYQIEKPSEGRVVLFDKDTSQLHHSEFPALRRRLGIVFQDFRLIPHLTALENAALPLCLAGAKPSQVNAHVTELLNWVGLGDRLHARPFELSGGEQQRVAIARAVVNKPKLLLADEPTGNVDDESAKKLMRLFLELNKMGTTIIFATHQQNIVKQYAKPVLRLKNGRLVTSFSEAA